MIKKTVEGYPYEEFIYCGCGCKKTRSKIGTDRTERKYIKGHYILSEEERRKISISKLGENNASWKGDDVGYEALHDWVIKQFPKTEFCMICRKVPPYDLANITGIYNRERKNWGWFCRKCHVEYDNVLQKSWITRKNKSPESSSVTLENFLENG